jgi:uncharacterized membrane protein YdjX (TVP38/TMEM64 family)
MTLPADREPRRLSDKSAARWRVRRILPLSIVAIVAATTIAMGWHRQLSLETLLQHRAAIDGFMLLHWTAALATFVVLYIVVVALSVPGAAILTICGGILFGTLLGGFLTVVGATAGATIVFLVTRSAIGDSLKRRVSGLTHKFAHSFYQDAFTYLLFLRLVPIFPFWLVNLVPAVCGVRLTTFVAATAVGIIPGTFAFAFFGAGLDSAMAAEVSAFNACVTAGKAGCSLHFDLAAAMTPQLIIALIALGIVSLAPIAVKRMRAGRVSKPT